MTQERFESLFHEAVQLHQAGKLSEAETAYRTALSLRPGDSNLLQMLGVVVAQQKRIDEGVAFLRQAIAISPGTTTTQVARSLRHREGIHIVTSAVNIGMEFSSLPNARVTLTGGSIRWPGSFSMVGATAYDSLQRLFFDKLFVGACGLHPQHGLTVIESDEALILGQMVKHTKQVIAVADASKLGVVSPTSVCSTRQIDTIVADDSIDPALVEAFREQQVRVVVV